MTIKQSIKAINEAVWDTRLTINERRFYKWISTQNKHKHLFFITGWKKDIGKYCMIKIKINKLSRYEKLY